ncbi:hypothetical protein FQN57_002994 [Myotisia sp. PD_48]|nr:hypothetical protein FQN57_002994 [Myotisia sp. PD_48]
MGGLSSACSTRYHGFGNPGELLAHCEDPQDEITYSRYESVARTWRSWQSDDWARNIMDWSRVLNIGDNFTSYPLGRSCIVCHMVMELMTLVKSDASNYSLNHTVPSLAETSLSLVPRYCLHPLNMHLSLTTKSTNPYRGALVSSTDYASGGSARWQGVFYVVLAVVFAINLLCLGDMTFCFWSVQTADFTEPHSAFALALNSSPCSKFQEKCGDEGPKGDQLVKQRLIIRDHQQGRF